MGYTINLIQDVATGGIWTGNRFREVLTQNDYAAALFIEGDPESIPNNFAGLKPGEYRIMTFLTYGDPSNYFPMVNFNPFSNFAAQPVANTVDVTFTGNGSQVTLDPQSPFDQAGAGRATMYVLFTEQQINDHLLNGFNAVIDILFNAYPEYNNLYLMEVGSDRNGVYSASGFSRNGFAGPISALYLFV